MVIFSNVFPSSVRFFYPAIVYFLILCWYNNILIYERVLYYKQKKRTETDVPKGEWKV